MTRLALLEEAYALTLRAADAPVAEAAELLRERGDLIARAAELPDEPAARVRARAIAALDRRYVDGVWQRHGEILQWFAERCPEEAREMPALLALAEARRQVAP
ncbi:MAG: hypothetical protein KC731_28520 [Myxococcales bacterium]|nr:hypothetical protein [Myxococcales bacterium]